MNPDKIYQHKKLVSFLMCLPDYVYKKYHGPTPSIVFLDIPWYSLPRHYCMSLQKSSDGNTMVLLNSMVVPRITCTGTNF